MLQQPRPLLDQALHQRVRHHHISYCEQDARKYTASSRDIRLEVEREGHGFLQEVNLDLGIIRQISYNRLHCIRLVS